MKSLILAAFAAVAFTGSVFSAEAAGGTEKLNATCCCGKPADAKVEAVSVKVGEADKKIAVCSKECAEAVRKMDPKAAVKAVQDHNKKDEAAK